MMTKRKKNEAAYCAGNHLWRKRVLLVTGVTFALLITGLVIRTGPIADTDVDSITVYKTSTCGCCEKWIEHLRDAGFKVSAINRDDMGDVKSILGVKLNFQSCHTATAGGYVVEGHVPAGDIKRLLLEKPDVTGITVPGMPMGSPGMEMEGHKAHRYQVLSFDKNGRTEVYAQH